MQNESSDNTSQNGGSRSSSGADHYNNDVAAGDEGFDIVAVCRHFLNHKVAVMAITLICTVLGGLHAFNATPIYAAEVMVAPASRNFDGGGLASLAGQLGGIASLAGIGGPANLSDKNEVLAILKSRTFTRKFIELQNVMPIMFADKWDSEANRWDVEDESGIPTDGDAFEAFGTRIRKISEDRETGLIKIGVQVQDRFVAAEWANSLVDLLNQEIRAREISLAERSLEFLNGELENSSVLAVQQAIYQLIQNEIEKIMIANVTDQYALIVLDKAVVPDEDNPVRPRKLLILMSAFMIGCFLSGLFVLIRVQWSRAG